MAIAKGGAFESFLKRPDTKISVLLVHGPDEGLVSERARAAVAAATGGKDDPFSLVRLTGQEVAADPPRLVDEAATVSLFGGRRTVFVREVGARNIAAAVSAVLERADLECLVVLEAGDIKKGAATLRGVVESHARGLAVACYADSEEEIERLVNEEARAAGLVVEPAAMTALTTLLGADRGITRQEVRKLCLYARGAATVTVDHVADIVGDVSEAGQDDALDAAALGDLDRLVPLLARLEAERVSPAAIGAAAVRHAQMLHRLAAEVAAGRRAEDAVDGLRPPVFFRRRPAIIRQTTIWSLDRATRALGHLDAALIASRRRPDLAQAIIADALIAVARLARAGRPPRRGAA